MAMAMATSMLSSAAPAALLTIRSSKAEGGVPLRRPSLPSLTPPPSPSSISPSPSPSPISPSPSPISPQPASSSVVTLEFQRQRAKELQQYFQDKKFEARSQEGRIFGWVRSNEIGNGRWAMFGFAVGLLTEYATGADFVEQLKIILSNLGIADLD